MSRQNKVNKTNYTQGGRLTPDEAARERKRQTDVSAGAAHKERVKAKADRSARGVRGASRPRSGREE